MQKEFAVITLLIVSSINGCVDFQPLANSIDKAVSVLDDAIFKLDNANADWQKILEDTRDQLTDSAQSTIRNEVSNTLTRAVAATGVEFRCDTDFIRNKGPAGSDANKSSSFGRNASCRYSCFVSGGPLTG